MTKETATGEGGGGYAFCGKLRRRKEGDTSTDKTEERKEERGASGLSALARDFPSSGMGKWNRPSSGMGKWTRPSSGMGKLTRC
mgnify:CR=1 FL=1